MLHIHTKKKSYFFSMLLFSYFIIFIIFSPLLFSCILFLLFIPTYWKDVENNFRHPTYLVVVALYVNFSSSPDLALHNASQFCNFIVNLPAGKYFQSQNSLCTLWHRTVYRKWCMCGKYWMFFSENNDLPIRRYAWNLK